MFSLLLFFNVCQGIQLRQFRAEETALRLRAGGLGRYPPNERRQSQTTNFQTKLATVAINPKIKMILKITSTSFCGRYILSNPFYVVIKAFSVSISNILGDVSAEFTYKNFYFI
jgi:hypothetical protein